MIFLFVLKCNLNSCLNNRIYQKALTVDKQSVLSDDTGMSVIFSDFRGEEEASDTEHLSENDHRKFAI